MRMSALCGGSRPAEFRERLPASACEDRGPSCEWVAGRLCTSNERLPYGFDNLRLGADAEIGVHGQAQDALSNPFGNRDSNLAAGVAVCWLLVEGDWVVHCRRDLRVGKESLKEVAIVDLYRELSVGTGAIDAHRRRRNALDLNQRIRIP